MENGRQGVCILRTCFVDVFVINVHTPFSIRFLDKHNIWRPSVCLISWINPSFNISDKYFSATSPLSRPIFLLLCTTGLAESMARQWHARLGSILGMLAALHAKRSELALRNSDRAVCTWGVVTSVFFRFSSLLCFNICDWCVL